LPTPSSAMRSNRPPGSGPKKRFASQGCARVPHSPPSLRSGTSLTVAGTGPCRIGREAAECSISGPLTLRRSSPWPFFIVGPG
jgi:hypothetical protein